MLLAGSTSATHGFLSSLCKARCVLTTTAAADETTMCIRVATLNADLDPEPYTPNPKPCKPMPEACMNYVDLVVTTASVMELALSQITVNPMMFRHLS